MHVFLSWSGQRSKMVADALHRWLPVAIQSVSMFASYEDTGKGARWNAKLAEQLESSGYGIVCLTRENLGSPWINFEAGALSKSIDESRVMPLLIGIGPADVVGPLSQFQSTSTSREDMYRLLGDINRALGESALPQSVLDAAFEGFWSNVEPAIRDAETLLLDNEPPKRPMDDIIEEILGISRSTGQIVFRVLEQLEHPSRGYNLTRNAIARRDARLKDVSDTIARVREMCADADRRVADMQASFAAAGASERAQFEALLQHAIAERSDLQHQLDQLAVEYGRLSA